MIESRFTCDKCGERFLEGFSLRFITGAIVFKYKWEYSDLCCDCANLYMDQLDKIASQRSQNGKDSL